MKKLFVALMALTVLGSQAFAAPAGLEGKVAREVKSGRDVITTKRAEVLNNLERFRDVTKNRTEFNASYTIQDMVYLMDSYLELVKLSRDVAFSLNGEINKNFEAGWGKTVTVKGLIGAGVHSIAPSPTRDDFETFSDLLDNDPTFVHVNKTMEAAPRFLSEENKPGLRNEAAKTFVEYFSANPSGEVQEAAYKPLADLLTSAIGLNQMIARTHNVDDRENFAIQWFFSNDIPGKYAALKAVNPELAAATNKLMNSFIDTVSNGNFYGGADHPDMKALREFKKDIGARY